MSNRCNCPNPPGGVVICENNQMALCVIQHGEIIQRCINPPQQGTPVEIVNWTLVKIMSEKRALSKPVEQYLVTMLKSGSYRSDKRNVTFSLPPIIQNAVEELDNTNNNLLTM